MRAIPCICFVKNGDSGKYEFVNDAFCKLRLNRFKTYYSRLQLGFVKIRGCSTRWKGFPKIGYLVKVNFNDYVGVGPEKRAPEWL